MKDQGINSGLVQEFDTTKKEARSFFGFRKMFWNFLNKLNVAFYDPCCTTASTIGAPIRYADSQVEYFDGSNWNSAVNVPAADFNTLANRPFSAIEYTSSTTPVGSNYVLFAPFPGRLLNQTLSTTYGLGTPNDGVTHMWTVGVNAVYTAGTGSVVFSLHYQNIHGTFIVVNLGTLSSTGTLTPSVYMPWAQANTNIQVIATVTGTVTYDLGISMQQTF